MSTSSNFNVIFEKALKAYQKRTKQDLTVHPLASQLQSCDSPAAILTILQGQVDQFIQSRSGDERLRSWLNPTISVLYAFSATLGEGVDFDIAELLYQHGADVDIRGYKNRTLLHAASTGGFVDIPQWVLDHCVDAHSQEDNHETPFHLTEANGRLGHCKSVDSMNNTNHTPLHLASLHGRFEIVRLLIEHGAEVTSQDQWHWTPLHLASTSGSAETVRQLIEHGAVVTSQDRWHWTPLHLLSSQSPEFVKLMIKHDMDVVARDGNCEAFFHWALSLCCPETVRLLIEHPCIWHCPHGGLKLCDYFSSSVRISMHRMGATIRLWIWRRACACVLLKICGQ